MRVRPQLVQLPAATASSAALRSAEIGSDPISSVLSATRTRAVVPTWVNGIEATAVESAAEIGSDPISPLLSATRTRAVLPTWVNGIEPTAVEP